MIIKTIAFGNWQEAFIESNIQNQVNVIFSDDNNRGKTLLVQSLMYCLGNSPIFPVTFDDYNHYFYVKAEVDRSYIEIIRRRNNFSVLYKEELKIFDSASDFKHFFDENIYRLPRYVSNGSLVVSDLSLFFQLFFLPQDKRNTSNTINHGYTNKEDFIEMIKSLATSDLSVPDSNEIKRLKEQIVLRKREISKLIRRNKFSRENPDLAERVQVSIGNKRFEDLEKELRDLNRQISLITNKRNRELNRKIKLENLIDELNSLNKNIEVGQVKCGDCGSNKIVYTSGDLVFEISNDIVRKQILKSISNQIAQRSEMVASLSMELRELQGLQKEKLEVVPVEVADLIISRDRIIEEAKNDTEFVRLQNEIQELEKNISHIESAIQVATKLGKELVDKIVIEARNNYKGIDDTSSIYIESLFTKHNETYSGSEGQIFYYSKLTAIASVLRIPFPIVVDSFRDGEISTDKERKMIDGFISLKKQVIITSTLKAQEYTDKKYNGINHVNAIDYSRIKPNHILSQEYADEFSKILKKFNLTFIQN